MQGHRGSVRLRTAWLNHRHLAAYRRRRVPNDPMRPGPRCAQVSCTTQPRAFDDFERLASMRFHHGLVCTRTCAPTHTFHPFVVYVQTFPHEASTRWLISHTMSSSLLYRCVPAHTSGGLLRAHTKSLPAIPTATKSTQEHCTPCALPEEVHTLLMLTQCLPVMHRSRRDLGRAVSICSARTGSRVKCSTESVM